MKCDKVETMIVYCNLIS